MLEKIKNKKFIIFTIVFIFSCIYIIVNIESNNNEEQTPSNVQTKVKYNELTIDESNRNDVVKEIGQPQNEYVDGDKHYLEYSTANPNYYDQFVFKDNKLQFVKKIITLDDTVRFNDLINRYGKADFILYGAGSGVGLYLHVYINKGIAILAHEVSGYVNEVWYFTPTDKKIFMDQFAIEYSETLDIHQ